MNRTRDNHFASKNESGAGDPEDTLRLIANLPSPKGLEERVKDALRTGSGSANVVSWPTELIGGRVWGNNPWARGAAAAAIVVVVAGGSWGVFSRVQPTAAPKAIALPHVQTSGGFSNAGAMRTPQTLNGPQVKNPVTGATKQAPTAKAAGGSALRNPKRSKTHAVREPAQ